MSLQFYIGASGTGKSTTVYKEILHQAQNEPYKRFFVIVPDQFTMQTQKVLCRLSESGGIMNVEVLSFGRLAHRIFEELGYESLPKLDDTGKNLILRKVAADCEEQLQLLGGNMRKVGYIAEVKSMISEFAQYGISPEDLGQYIEQSEGKGQLKAKLSDLRVLYHGYKKYIADRFITTEETIDILVRSIHESELIKGSVVVFDGFTGFTPIQDRLLQELMIHTERVIVTLLADSMEDFTAEDITQGMFYLTAKAYRKLNRLAEECGVARDEDVILDKNNSYRFSNNHALKHLEQSLFRVKANAPVSCEGNVQLLHCMNSKAETDYVCLEIKRLIREKGYCYRDFAVVSGDLQSYGYLLKESFAEHAIPLYLDQNTSLLYHPLMVFLMGLLHVVTTDYSYEAVMDLLRVGYFDLEEEQIDAFERFILRKGIRGKKKYHAEFIGADYEKDTAEIVRNELVSALRPLHEAANSAKSYVVALHDICVMLDLEHKLDVKAEAFADHDMPAKAKEYGQVYGAVISLFDQIYALLDEEMSPDEFTEILKAGFAELKVGTIPQSVDQVVAGDLERTRLKPIKVLFIVGANDGIIPSQGASGGILSDLERTFLSDLGVELAPTPREKGLAERLYLYMNMTQPSDALYVSFAEVNSSGEQVRPSYLIRVIEKLYTDLSVRIVDDKQQLYMVESKESAMKLLARLLREYVAGIVVPESNEWEYLISLAKAFENEPESESMLDAAFYRYHNVPLPGEIAENLFGRILHTSVSRLEQFSACAYAHFLKYGLKLQEEEEFSFNITDLGTMYHDILFRFGKYLELQGYSWFSYPEEEADAFIANAVDEFATDYHNEVLLDNARNEALKERTKHILKTSVDNLTYQLRQGLFEPECYELSFNYNDDSELYGKIDRLDIVNESDKVYVKVLDYKSGAHSFDPVRFFYGLDLQLAVYLNAAVAREQKIYPGKEVVPSAILYYQIIDPMVEATVDEGPEARTDRIRRELKVQGLILEEDEVLEKLDQSQAEDSAVIPVKFNKNGSLSSTSQTASKKQFEIISKYATHKIKEIGEQIRSGNIEISPFEESNKNACGYCAYKHICGYEHRIPGFRARTAELKKDEAYDEMEKEVAVDELHD